MSPIVTTLIILFCAAILFVSEFVPVGVTSFSVSVALFLTGVLNVQSAFSGLMDPSVILFGGMFVVAGSLFETGLADKVGQKIVLKFGSSERKLLIAVMSSATILSVFLSNTAVVASLMPVVISLADSAGYARSKFLIPLAISAAMGGAISLVGTPPNLIMHSYLEKAGLPGFGFFEFAYYGVPAAVATIIFMATVGMKILPNYQLTPEELEEVAKRNEKLKTNNDIGKQRIAAVIFVLTALGMFLSPQIKIPVHVVAVVGALALVYTKVITDKQAYKSVDWNTMFLTGCMMPMAIALDKTGAGKLIATTVLSWCGTDPSPILLVAVFFLLAAVLTQFMSNIALAALLGPIALGVSLELGVDPKAMMLAVGFASNSAFTTPVGTPATAIVFGPGRYKFMDFVKIGTPILIIAFILAVIILPIAWPFN